MLWIYIALMAVVLILLVWVLHTCRQFKPRPRVRRNLGNAVVISQHRHRAKTFRSLS